jgi:hypothetical protein
MFATVGCFPKVKEDALEKGLRKLLKKYPLYLVDEPFHLVDLSKL